MGSRAYLCLGDLTLSQTNREIDPSVMMLFTEADKRVSRTHVINLSSDPNSDNAHSEEEDIDVTFEYRASLAIVKDRLEFMGFTLTAVKTAFQAGIEEELASNEERSQQHNWA